MILAFEGPDMCGKTTLWDAVQHKCKGSFRCPRLPVDDKLLAIMDAVEERTDLIWRSMYDPQRLYVCDRHFSITGPVYDRLYGRTTRFDPVHWWEELILFYINVPREELERRYAAKGDWLFDSKDYYRLLLTYSEVLTEYCDKMGKQLYTLDGTKRTAELVMDVKRVVPWPFWSER